MKLSTKGRYGLRALIDLAVYCEEDAVSIQSIAKRQNISDRYLEQLMGKLKKAGLVTFGGLAAAIVWQGLPERYRWGKFSGHWKGIWTQ